MILPRHVYAIQHNVTKRMYIGSSGNVESRYKDHIHMLRKGEHSVEDMQEDFDLHGEDYSLFILEKITEYDKRSHEYDWMRKYKTHIRGIGYNYKDRVFTSKKVRMEIPLKEGLPVSFLDYQNQKL